MRIIKPWEMELHMKCPKAYHFKRTEELKLRPEQMAVQVEVYRQGLEDFFGKKENTK